MTDPKIPLNEGMGDTADQSIDPTMLPNRGARRLARTKRGKRKIREELRKTQLAGVKEKAVDNERNPTQEEILKHVDVQAFLHVLNDLLTGRKKLVIESRAHIELVEIAPEYGMSELQHYTHTFRVEDCK